MSNSISLLNEAASNYQPQQEPKKGKKRSLPGNPDPDAEVISLSPRTLLATNRFVCEICKKGFQRDQNLQLHRRGHNLPWKLKQRSSKEAKKKAYVCPEPGCVHHSPSRALGDLTGIKKHFCRKHGEKKFKCEKCSKMYAVHSDWKAHSKTCGSREYRCDCGTLFSRKDSFITHRAFCDALAEESVRLAIETNPLTPSNQPPPPQHPQNPSSPLLFHFSSTNHRRETNRSPPPTSVPFTSTWDTPSLATDYATYDDNKSLVATSPFAASRHAGVRTTPSDSSTSATALLQRACTMGAITSTMGGIEPLVQIGTKAVQPPPSDQYMGLSWTPGDLAMWRSSDHLTRDFLGLAGHHQYSAGGGAHVSIGMNDMLTYAEGLEYADCSTTTVSLCDNDYSLKHQQSFGLAPLETWGDA